MRYIFYMLIIMLGMFQIFYMQGIDQSLHVSKNGAASSHQSYTIHEDHDAQMPDLNFYEWLQKYLGSMILYIHILLYKSSLYILGYGSYEYLSLLQERFAECSAELGNISQALYYSEQSLLSSAQYLEEFIHSYNEETLQAENVENMREHIMHYTQHVQTHIISMTDFASEEKDSEPWYEYEHILMQYFEKMQQTMQLFDEEAEYD